MSTTIRQANVNDEGAIARVHIDSWRTAYSGIIRQGVLDALDEEAFTADWASGIGTFRGEKALFVAEHNGLVTGFAAAGRGRDAGFQDEAELYCIYVATSAMGKGAGAKLFNACAGHSHMIGLTTMYNWCLEENYKSHAFYQRMGAIFIQGIERDFEMQGTSHRVIFFRKE